MRVKRLAIVGLFPFHLGDKLIIPCKENITNIEDSSYGKAGNDWKLNGCQSGLIADIFYIIYLYP